MRPGLSVRGRGAFDAHWRRAREQLEQEFERQLPQFFDGLPSAHMAAVRDALAGGKRLRGCLVVLLNDALGGAPTAAFPRALAVECVQAASLVHDDFIDGDTLRRDRPALWTVQGARRAVLLGDVIFATALRRMAELGQADGAALAQAVATMAAGAYQEPLASSDLVADAWVDAARLYPRLIHLKTGVLFGAAAQLGALAAGVPASVAAQAFRYGALVGQAYQIADDVHDWLATPPDAARCLLIAPALWHFCADAGPASHFELPAPQHVEHWRAALRERMLAAVAHRVQQAIAAVDLLPGGPRMELLRVAPHAIVGAMPAGAP